MAGQQCWALQQLSVRMQQQVKSFLESSKTINYATIEQNDFRKKYWQTCHDDFRAANRSLPNNRSTHPRCRLMKKQTNQTPRVEEGKVIAERLNGYAAFVGCWALIGAYLTTGQIIPGVV